MSDLTALIASENALVQEAALALPHSFDKCTHDKGPIRQAVHLCLTCGIPRGLCSACSVACHGDHEQIELFPKRAFVCDCPTTINGTSCTLHKGPVAGNESNSYSQNFEAKFCRCHRQYDAKRERETMIQCVYCEDWYHESCLNLRTRPNERSSTPQQVVPEADDQDVGDADSNASNDLPPPLLPSAAYDSFICGACVLSNDTLKRWAGTKGIVMVYTSAKDEANVPVGIEEGGIDPKWNILDGDDELSSLDVDSEIEERKRGLEAEPSDSADVRPVKKFRTENGCQDVVVAETCLAPPLNPVAQSVLSVATRFKPTSLDDVTSEFVGQGDIFLTEGWRERWCRCSACLPSLQQHPFLLEEEETYVPPEDPDSGMSLEELGMRALLNLPRDRAIDGIQAYNTMRDELISYLRPFAQEGRIVREEDVREFFEAKVQEAKS